MTGSDAPDEGQWRSAADRWHLLGPPLRPGAPDVALYQAAVDERARGAGLGEALILGVTPEIGTLAWPEGARVTALDRSREMIDKVWPGNPEDAVEGDWCAPPFAAGRFDMAFCDGGFHVLDPRQQAAFVAGLGRIVVAGGIVALRLYLPPATRETPDDVIRALGAGAVASMNALKLRLAHALAGRPEEGVMLDAIWRALHDRIGNRDHVFDRLGWSREEVAMIDLYRGSAARYYFDRPEAIRAVLEGGGAFRLLRTDAPAQPMGDQCVHVRLERR